MAFITKEDALIIARKLGAKVDPRPKRHDLARVFEKGILIASFGIRRGSKKDLGHDHIPGALYIRPHEARDLADCTKLREWWIASLKNKGFIV